MLVGSTKEGVVGHFFYYDSPQFRTWTLGNVNNTVHLLIPADTPRNCLVDIHGFYYKGHETGTVQGEKCADWKKYNVSKHFDFIWRRLHFRKETITHIIVYVCLMQRSHALWTGLYWSSTNDEHMAISITVASFAFVLVQDDDNGISVSYGL